MRITDEKMGWPDVDGRPPRAGFSSYGWSGTNAHVIIECYGQPAAPPSLNGNISLPVGGPLAIEASAPGNEARQAGLSPAKEARPVRLLPMSGKSEAALRESSQALLAWLDEHENGENLADLAWFASVARSHFDFRDGVVFQDVISLPSGLEAVAGSPGLAFLPRAARVAFV